jgi:hypothetical protein
MARYVELRRHTDNDGDALTEEGVRAARDRAAARRWLRAAGLDRRAARDPDAGLLRLRAARPGAGRRGGRGGVALPLEDRWRDAYKQAGSGDLDALSKADPELVAEDSAVVGAALRRVLERLPDGGKALAVGHSPTNEAAVLGLTGEIIEPLGKGAGVLVVAEADDARVEPLEPA